MNKSTRERRELVDQQNEKLSMRRQCDLLTIHRSGLYYKPIGESEFNLELIRLIDEEFMRHPFKGSPQMCTYLREDLGLKVNHKRVERLYRLLALCATVPRPNTSKRNKAHKVYPYLLRKLKKLKKERPIQVAIDEHGTPEIINTDQGSQFTSTVFTN